MEVSGCPCWPLSARVGIQVRRQQQVQVPQAPLPALVISICTVIVTWQWILGGGLQFEDDVDGRVLDDSDELVRAMLITGDVHAGGDVVRADGDGEAGRAIGLSWRRRRLGRAQRWSARYRRRYLWRGKTPTRSSAL